MRKLSLLALIIVSVFLSGCSFSTILTVVNRSDKPVEVRYRFKGTPGASDPRNPSIKPISELHEDSAWNELRAEQYEKDANSLTLIVTIAPQTALLLDRVRGRGIPDDDTEFPISEIVMRGSYGTIMLHGAQVRKSFTEDEKGVYSVAYR